MKDQHGNVPSLITFSSRNHGRHAHTPCTRFRASVALRTHSHESRCPLAKVQISRQIKSFSRRSSWLESSSHVSLKSLHGANRRRSPPILSLLFLSRPRFEREAGRITKPSTHVRDPPRSRGSSFTWRKFENLKTLRNLSRSVVIHIKHFLTRVD